MFTTLALLVVAQAETPTLQSWEVPSIEVVDDTPQVFALSREQKRACPEKGMVCFGTAGSDTVRGIELVDSRGPVTVLARGTQQAVRGGLVQAKSEQSWQAEVVARFRTPSQAGPILVAVFDREDQESLIENTPMMVWTVTMEPGRDLGMRMLFSPQDGFVPSRTYTVEVVQTVNDQVRGLAEGDVHLE